MLPRQNRISSGSEIKDILQSKQIKANTLLLSCFAKTNNFQDFRLAIICKKRLGNAVVRNRLRRRISAACLKIMHNNAKNIDLVVIPKAFSAIYPEIEANVSGLLASIFK